jgi:ribonuclease HII
MIVGVDEAGRGPLAGPVVAAAVVLCAGGIDGLDDSKKLREPRRIALEAQIKARCRWAVGIADVEEIDGINILQATLLAMTRAVEGLGIEPGEILVDGNRLPKWRWTAARAIVDGDALEPCISAASIIAKQARDTMMVEADGRWPGYGFARHKGYGTAEHREALARLGPCPIHRRSFAPVREQLALF